MFHQNMFQHIFSKILPKYEIEVNFSVQSHASLTCEDPVYLQITYHYVYYWKYTELKTCIPASKSLIKAEVSTNIKKNNLK